ncbi:hypothetical protein [Streptomyces sp. NPDC006925]|uniref:hypothetical protein n=1 Tax=Streptomyces sp. NPDC006925 TaxID=3364768 RepID=UPI0036ACBF9A
MLTPAGESPEQPHEGVLRGDSLVEETQMRLAAQEGGQPVQGLACRQDYHRVGARRLTAGGPQRGRLGQATGKESDLMRQSPKAAGPAA